MQVPSRRAPDASRKYSAPSIRTTTRLNWRSWSP